MTASTDELHTASDKWLSNLILALAKFAVRRPKTRWVDKVELKFGDFQCQLGKNVYWPPLSN